MNFDAYLARIGASRPEHPTAAALTALHEAHVRAVPFENYDIQLGIALALDIPALEAKIVGRKRGGFCYELNGLFAALLRELGYEVTPASAFELGEDGTRGPEFEHMLLIVETSDGPMLADVGNGARRLRPVPAEPGEYGDLRVHRDGDVWWTTERHLDSSWTRGWAWTAEPHELADFTPRCRYQEHDPASHFVQNRLASFATDEGRITLLNGVFAEVDAGGRTERPVDADEERALLRERFGIVADGSWS